MMIALGFRAMVSLPIVMISLSGGVGDFAVGRGGGIGMVLPPMIRADDARETGVPETVMPGLPGKRVVPLLPRAMPLGFAV